MNPDQEPYRELYDRLLSQDDAALYNDVLRPWLSRHDGERRWLDSLRDRPAAPVPHVSVEESQRLYALSRIIQLLQLSFAPVVDVQLERAWSISAVTAGEFAAFMEALGLERVDRADFHPFFHEIVTVDEAPDHDARPEISGVYWPAYMLGPLLVSRAGCRVRAGRAHLRREIAEHSTLYWAYARNTRPTMDLSAGWGGNSQWRTSFRRDYAIAGELRYNVDARPKPIVMDEDLTAAEKLELLRHRCFVTSPRPHDDRWPYDLTHVESA